MGRASSRVLRERANLSFCIVVIFFGIFSVIVLTEILLIDQSGRNKQSYHTRSNYDDTVILAQHGEDYLLYQEGVFFEEGKRKSVQPTVTSNMTATDGQWQSVAGTKNKFYVFSAYYDRRGGRSIRIIGATKTRGQEKIWCLFYYSTGNSSYVQPRSAHIRVIRENWNMKYSACFILCPLHEDTRVPSSVSIVSKAGVAPGNRLRVNHYFNGSDTVPRPPHDKIGICVKPLHFYYNNAIQVLEFLELNLLLGMDHITFYNNTIGTGVNCILQHYQSEGRVTVLPWKLNMQSQKEIRTEGLFAALNDCLYRSMYTYSHIALIDLDEIIMPKHNNTIQQFLEWMGSRVSTRSTGSYSFQNAFFYLQWPDDSGVGRDPIEANLITLRKTRRKAKLHPHKQRSKYLARPEFVVEAGNHFVWEFVPGHGTLNVPPDVGILNHYRVCEFGGNDCVRSPSVIDRTAYRYKRQLVDRVKSLWNQLQETCSLPDIKSKLNYLRPPTQR